MAFIAALVEERECDVPKDNYHFIGIIKALMKSSEPLEEAKMFYEEHGDPI